MERQPTAIELTLHGYAQENMALRLKIQEQAVEIQRLKEKLATEKESGDSKSTLTEKGMI